MDPASNQWEQSYVNVKSKFKEKEEIKDSFLTPDEMSSDRGQSKKLKKKKSNTTRTKNYF